jgi:NAD(P)H-dependent FMN reductase
VRCSDRIHHLIESLSRPTDLASLSLPDSLDGTGDAAVFAKRQAKPVGFVSYGGIAGGLRAVEELRLVFAGLHAVTVRQVVSLHWVGELFDGNGVLTDRGAPDAAQKMLTQLVWWARALRGARAEGVDDA